jgi:bifunctional pyridoxal-dependent enzyme with beta-cystathionase and maltose regulon repressor activities
VTHFTSNTWVNASNISSFIQSTAPLSLLLRFVYRPPPRSLQVRNQVQPVPAYLDLSQQDLTAGLDAAAATASSQGRRVSAVLFTNPNNPDGVLYSREQLSSIISWCLRHKVHCIG